MMNKASCNENLEKGVNVQSGGKVFNETPHSNPSDKDQPSVQWKSSTWYQVVCNATTATCPVSFVFVPPPVGTKVVLPT